MLIDQVKTFLLLLAMGALFFWLGYMIGGKEALPFALIMAIVMNGVVYFFSDKIVLNLYRAKPLDKKQHAAIYGMVQDLADTMKLPMPKLWLIQSPMANAFATGRNPNNASVAVTTGILDILDLDELRGVLAHELSHVQNRDILVGTVAATIATAIGYVARTAQFSAMMRTERQESQRRSNPLSLLLVSVLMPIAAALMQFAISRSREYLADEHGAGITHEPLALAAALQKLEQRVKSAHLDPRDTARASTAPLFIVNPFTSGSLLTLFSTHPPMAKRIERLQKMAARKKSF